MSDKDVLGGIALASVVGPIGDLNSKLAGKEGEKWLAAFKRFLRGENPWPEVPLWRKVGDLAIEVNLDAPPVIPFADATVEWTKPGQTGWIRVERIGDLLFVGGNEVLLHLDAGQLKGKSIVGTELRKKLEREATLHPNILDALFENQHLIPDNLKQNEDGNTIYLYFWSVVYRHSGGDLYVRYVYFSGGRWHRRCNWLGGRFGGQSPAAVSAS
ncbi:MAG: hypothetical protein AAB431_02935 [Patescibacteria group bacterium]